MIGDIKDRDVYMKPGTTDMRKQINGLSVIVQELLKQNPFSGSYFMFCNKQRNLLTRNQEAFYLRQHPCRHEATQKNKRIILFLYFHRSNSIQF